MKYPILNISEVGFALWSAQNVDGMDSSASFPSPRFTSSKDGIVVMDASSPSYKNSFRTLLERQYFGYTLPRTGAGANEVPQLNLADAINPSGKLDGDATVERAALGLFMLHLNGALVTKQKARGKKKNGNGNGGEEVAETPDADSTDEGTNNHGGTGVESKIKVSPTTHLQPTDPTPVSMQATFGEDQEHWARYLKEQGRSGKTGPGMPYQTALATGDRLANVTIYCDKIFHTSKDDLDAFTTLSKLSAADLKRVMAIYQSPAFCQKVINEMLAAFYCRRQTGNETRFNEDLLPQLAVLCFSDQKRFPLRFHNVTQRETVNGKVAYPLTWLDDLVMHQGRFNRVHKVIVAYSPSEVELLGDRDKYPKDMVQFVEGVACGYDAGADYLNGLAGKAE